MSTSGSGGSEPSDREKLRGVPVTPSVTRYTSERSAVDAARTRVSASMSNSGSMLPAGGVRKSIVPRVTT